MPVLFIVDDDVDIRISLEYFFNQKQYTVHTFPDKHNVLESVMEYKPDLVLMDVYLHGEDGRQICQTIKETAQYPVKIILFSASPMALLTYEYSFADGIINKPFELEDLEIKCRKLLARPRK